MLTWLFKFFVPPDIKFSRSATGYMYTVGPVCLGLRCQPSHCFKNGGELLIRELGGPFSLYDPKTKEIKEFDVSNRTTNAVV